MNTTKWGEYIFESAVMKTRIRKIMKAVQIVISNYLFFRKHALNLYYNVETNIAAIVNHEFIVLLT